jgi:hypothetical protein
MSQNKFLSYFVTFIIKGKNMQMLKHPPFTYKYELQFRDNRHSVHSYGTGVPALSQSLSSRIIRVIFVYVA